MAQIKHVPIVFVQADFSPASQAQLRRVWRGMRARCLNPNHPSFSTHGGRGIGVHPAWRHDFGAFRAWAVSNRFELGLALDRIDKGKSFSPDNCRWSPTWCRSHFSHSVTRSDGRRFESLRAAVRATPKTSAHRITLVSRGYARSCGGFGWSFDSP